MRHRTGLRRLFSGIVVVALALPVAAYFWFIHHYAVNTIFGDQWADINVLKHLYAGKLNLATLWTQHNEERNLFSNVVVVVLGETSHFNVVTEMYISAVLLAGAACLFIIAHKARSVSTPLFVYVPVSLILFTFAQSTNTLWGFQVAWYIVLVALATALLLLDRPNLRRLVLAGAVVAAVVGSFSLLQGLFIWPAGIVLLIQRRRSWKTVAVWVAAAVVSATVYFYNFKFNGPGTSRDGSARTHWRTTIEFFFIAIGRAVWIVRPHHSCPHRLRHRGRGPVVGDHGRCPPWRDKRTTARRRAHLVRPAVCGVGGDRTLLPRTVAGKFGRVHHDGPLDRARLLLHRDEQGPGTVGNAGKSTAQCDGIDCAGRRRSRGGRRRRAGGDGVRQRVARGNVVVHLHDERRARSVEHHPSIGQGGAQCPRL